MTEDDVRFRFEIVKGKEWIKDYGSDSASKYDIYEGLYSVTKLLNKLHMENMGLKSSNREYEDALGRLEEENEDHKYLLRVYTDFMVSKGYELSDVIEYSKEMEELTEKRFKKDRGTFWDNDKRLNMTETVDLLNQLNEENQQLKKDIDQFSNWKIEFDSPQRQNIDKILNLSVIEILEAFEYYKKRIRDLEKELSE